MKKIILSGIALISMFIVACSSSGKKAEFYVRGNCGMCQERIETTLKSTPGVNSASWNVETKMATVEFDSTKVTQAKLEETVANVGHETKTNTSPTAVHDALPECCKKGNSM
jgi:periplasmic mercuric ion binding protein